MNCGEKYKSSGPKAVLLAVGVSGLPMTPVQGDLQSPDWWDPDGVGTSPDRHYRVPVAIPACSYPNSTIRLDVDFDTLLSQMGAEGTFDRQSLRVVNGDGELIDTQQYTDTVYGGASDAIENGRGEIRFLLRDTGPATYYIYFDILENGANSSWPAADTINGNFEFSLLSDNKVVADLYSPAGDPVADGIVLFNDGTHGDSVAGDELWANDGSVPEDITYGFSAAAMTVLAVCLVALQMVCGGTVWALGTPASTIITNTAGISYTQGGGSDPITLTASSSFEVLEIIDGVVTWQDAADIAVNSPHSGAILEFLLINTGNGPESYQLSVLDSLPEDDFDPLARQLWLESNSEPGIQISGTNPDTLYQSSANDPVLMADGSQVIYMLSDIPIDQDDSDRGQARLIIQAATPGAAGAAPGTELIGQGLNGGNAVVGSTRAEGAATGWFSVAAVRVALAKSIVAISDTTGGDQPYPGARVTYRIQVDVSGTGLAEDLVISDAIPAEMIYVPGSLTLDGVPQSDDRDMPEDLSDDTVTTPAVVTVNLGDVNPPAVRLIEFETTIK